MAVVAKDWRVLPAEGCAPVADAVRTFGSRGSSSSALGDQRAGAVRRAVALGDGLDRARVVAVDGPAARQIPERDRARFKDRDRLTMSSCFSRVRFATGLSTISPE